MGEAAAFAVRASSVLIVEDDDDVRESLAETVERAGYRVATARHGGDALAYLDAIDPEPDVMLLDLMMPIVDGWSVLRHLEARERAIPVVVVSAAHAPALPANVGFLAKPTRRDELLAAIEARCPPQIIESPPKIDLTLFVAAGCARSERARAVVERVRERYDRDEVRVRVIDIATATRERLDRDLVVAAPTLVMHHPLKLRIPYGPVETTYLMGLFDMAEVPRRRW